MNVKTIFTLSETQGRTLRGMHEYCSVVVGIHGEATTRRDNIGDSQDISQSMFVSEYLELVMGNARPVAGLGGGERAALGEHIKDDRGVTNIFGILRCGLDKAVSGEGIQHLRVGA